MPDCVGVPLIVKPLFAHIPVTPFGKPVTVAPVAPVVLYVILLIAVLIHTVCPSDPTPDVLVIVLFGVTFIVPDMVTLPQPPVKVIV